MKTLNLSFFVLISLMITMNFSSCGEDSCIETRTLYVWEPVYKDATTLRSEFAIESPRALVNPGKIYFYDNYIFISETNEGIHIIDNTDQANPAPVQFIKIPGTTDMSVKNGRLYANNFIDLLTIDITDPTNPTLTNRTEEVFKDYNWYPDHGYLISYENSLETHEVDCQSHYYIDGWGWCSTGLDLAFAERSILANASFDISASGAAFNASVPSSPSVGTGGSFARFTIAKEHLYTVDEFELNTFDLTNCDDPSYLASTYLGWGIETIYPLGDNLFIGSNDGMFIYSIAEPSAPVQLSQFQHARACDPVFVSGNKAYVTLRDGNNCTGVVNQLDVLDVSTLTTPQLITSHSMENPHGLSILGDHIFICEGAFGLKAFDRTDDFAISQNLLSHITDIHAYDIITLSNQSAMVIGQDGLYQYDISDPSDLKEISRIAVDRP